jgi:hypothetical protein
VEQAQPGLEKLQQQTWFKPIVGIVWNLSRDEAASQSLLSTFARHALLSVEAFEFMAQFKWDWGAEVVEGSADPGLQALSSFTLSLKQARSDVSTLGEDLGEIPDEFLDPITQELMQVCPRVVHTRATDSMNHPAPHLWCVSTQDPVILPTSAVSMDRDTIARHLLSDQSDPFNRNPLTMDMLKDNTELSVQTDSLCVCVCVPCECADDSSLCARACVCGLRRAASKRGLRSERQRQHTDEVLRRRLAPARVQGTR